MWWVFDTETDSSHFDDKGKPTETYIWAWAAVRANGNPHAKVYDGTDFLSMMRFMSQNIKPRDIVFFHNLKWDGYFILYALLEEYGYVNYEGRPKDQPKGSFSTLISGNGVWYKITIKTQRGVVINIQDSLKKLPFKAAKIAKDLKLPVQKGEIDYHKRRIPGDPLSPEDRVYVHNDVKIIAQALYNVFVVNGWDRMTIGSDCLADFKKNHFKNFDKVFPALTYEEESFVRQSYRGGITYVKGGQHEAYNGCVFDATSLYPSVMHSKSGNYYPCGEGVYFEGRPEPTRQYPLFIVEVELTAKVKEGYLPFVNLRNTMFGDKSYMEECDGQTLVFTSVDLELLYKHYDIKNIVFKHGYYYHANIGMFDHYIDYYFDLKYKADKEDNAVMRYISKLFLNNLYGKFATRIDKVNALPTGIANDKVTFSKYTDTADGVYSPVGVFVTAYGRANLLDNVQRNWDVFDYCDTDSIHLHCSPKEANLPHIGRELCEWKLESCWDKARFVRQKTYVESVIWDDKHGEHQPELEFKCAGATPEVKELFTWENFKLGLELEACKPTPKKCKGGVVLVKGPFHIREAL